MSSINKKLFDVKDIPFKLRQYFVEIEVQCGAQWARIVDTSRTFESGSGKSGNMPSGKNGPNMQGGGETLDVRRGPTVHTTTLGWCPTCNHKAKPVPCLVLDPFMGSGTVGLVASRLNRNYTGIDINSEYVKKQARPNIAHRQRSRTSIKKKSNRKELF